MARKRPAPRDLHPAELRRADVLADPLGYTASIRFAGRNNTLRAGTVMHAGLAALALEQGVTKLGGSTRATVYAVPRDGGGPEIVDRVAWESAARTHLAQRSAAQAGYSLTPSSKA